MQPATSYTIHKLGTEMDRTAEKVLQKELNISYSRFYFLLIVSEHSSPTQHAIAQALGYSDPAVSNMTSELAGEGLIRVVADPNHGRRRLVTLTQVGREIVAKSLRLLDDCFSDVALRAGVDEAHYAQLTQKLITALEQKNTGDI
jgi:DNA-binding MarR family transcriptional regulator